MAIGRPKAGMAWEDPGRELDTMDIREILCAKDTKGSYVLFLQLEQQQGKPRHYLGNTACTWKC